MLKSQLVSTSVGETENIEIVLHRKTSNVEIETCVDRWATRINFGFSLLDKIIICITILDALFKHYLIIEQFIFSSYLTTSYVLIIGDVCMAMLLMYCFSTTIGTNIFCHAVTGLLMIPISMILSPISAFIIYEVTKNYNNPKFLHKLSVFNIYVKPPNYEIKNESSMNLYRYLQIAKYRHKGLLIQTIFSVIIAIIQWYNISESNITKNYFSIVMSAIMILFTSIIFQIRNTLFTQSFCFNVLITVYDLVGACVIITVIYYNEYSSSNWYYVSLSVSCSIIACIPFMIMLVVELILTTSHNNSVSIYFLFAPVWFFAGVISSSLVCFSFLMTSVDRLFQSRFQYNNVHKYTEYDTIFWSEMRQFLSQCVNDQDCRHRICCINMEMFTFQNYGKKQCALTFMDWSADNNSDSEFEFKLFLKQQQQHLYQCIDTYTQLRGNISKHPLVQILFPLAPKMWFFIVKEFKEIVANWVLMIFLILLIPCTIGILLVMLLSPLYSISRVIYICLPFITLSFSKYSIFLIVWLLFSSVVLIAFINEMKIYHYFYNILPLAKIPSIENKKTMVIHIRGIYSRYTELSMIPEREQIIIDFFGNDVGSIINQLIGRFT